jgi:hypothetical protein
VNVPQMSAARNRFLCCHARVHFVPRMVARYVSPSLPYLINHYLTCQLSAIYDEV